MVLRRSAAGFLCERRVPPGNFSNLGSGCGQYSCQRGKLGFRKAIHGNRTAAAVVRASTGNASTGNRVSSWKSVAVLMTLPQLCPARMTRFGDCPVGGCP